MMTMTVMTGFALRGSFSFVRWVAHIATLRQADLKPGHTQLPTHNGGGNGAAWLMEGLEFYRFSVRGTVRVM